MNARAAAWVCAGVALCAAAPSLAAQAAEGHAAHGPDWGYFFFHLVGISLLLGVLVYFARAPLTSFLADRSDAIRRQIEAAESALAEARRESAELRARLDRMSQEQEALVRQAADQAEAERAAAVERAGQAAERVREEARRAGDQEIARARRELRDEAATLATQLAAELLRQSVTPADDERIVREFVARIGERG